MKLLSGILGLTLTSVVALASANAADLSGPAMGGLKDGPYYGPSWAGFYVGANLGYAWGTAHSSCDANSDGYCDLGSPATIHVWNNNPSGFLGGMQWGYNIQHEGIVFGPEFDIGYLDLSSKVISGHNFSETDPGIYGDATLRVGYAWDRVLVYAKGGLGFYDGRAFINAPANETLTRIGWTVGGGLEYKVNPNWSVKGEYLHTEYGTSSTLLGDSLALETDTVKVGVNYFPGFVYEPLK